MSLTANLSSNIQMPAATSDKDEKVLVMLLSQGNEIAFEKVYHLYGERLLGNLIKIVKSEALACEIVQDTFVKVWNNRQNIDPELSFRSYLFRIAENLIYDMFRKAARDKKLQAELINAAVCHYEHVEEHINRNEDVQLLHKAINALPAQRRLVFQLIKLEGRSYVDVSRRLNISTSTISDHIVKATKFIRTQLRGNYFKAISILVLSLLR